LLIKYIESVLWRVAKCLSYIEKARCLKVKQNVARVNSAVNFTKPRGLSQRQFRMFLHELESENGDTVYYSEAL